MKKNKYLYAVIDEHKEFTAITSHKFIGEKVHIIRPLSIFASLEYAEKVLKLSKRKYKTLTKDERTKIANPNKAKIIKIKYN